MRRATRPSNQADHDAARDVGGVVDLGVDTAERHDQSDRIVERRPLLAFSEQGGGAEGGGGMPAREA